MNNGNIIPIAKHMTEDGKASSPDCLNLQTKMPQHQLNRRLCLITIPRHTV